MWAATDITVYSISKEKKIPTIYKHASPTPLYIYLSADTASDVTIIKSCKLVPAFGKMSDVT